LKLRQTVTMDGKRVPQPSRLFENSLLESKDEFEDKYEKCYGLLKGLTEGKGDRECNDALNTAVAKDSKSHEDICTGFIVAILIEPENAAKHYRHLTLTAKDGLHFVLQELGRLVQEKFLKLKETPVKAQVLWFTKEMIKNQVQNIDTFCWILMRQIAGGDVHQKNLWLADSLMDIFAESRAWLEKYPMLLASVVYTYLRVIEDHHHQNLTALRSKEVAFVVSLIRDRFLDVLVIGRDLIRLLQNIARIPEIEKIWNDILYNPTNLHPTFTGLVQIMNSRTSRRFLQSRITPDMEKKLVFLTSQVRFGSHKRYQDWFQRTYLASLESQTLRCDLIRFIVGVIHPTNELLCSDIIPRLVCGGYSCCHFKQFGGDIV
jgi:integrator complex subunit 3